MSELSEAISKAMDSTTNHAELIDRVIEQHARLLCSFCGVVTFNGTAVKGDQWTPEAKDAIVTHARTCEKRPEKALIAYAERLGESLQNMVDSPPCSDPDCCETAIKCEAARASAKAVLAEKPPC